MLGNISMLRRPTKLDSVEQGPIGLAVGAGGLVWTFFLSSIFTHFFSPSLGDDPI